MGFDCGFDIVPRLQDTPNDNAKWKAVMDEVTITFLHDPVVVTKAKYLEFQVGEYPLLPFQGHKLLRFSSKISSERTQNAEQYIKAVCRIAKRHLGEQVQFWHEAADNYGHYDWGAVNESFKDMLSDEKHETDASRAENCPKPIYAVKQLPGKNLGLVARQPILKGTRILSESPLLTITNSPAGINTLNAMVASKLRTLGKPEQRAFLELQNCHAGTLPPFAGIFKTNALPLGPGSPHGAVYLIISRINHACRSNTQHTWNEHLRCETIHAVRDIAEGEEITIMYHDGPFVERRDFLASHFGFDCTCLLCKLSPLERALSDARLEDIDGLDERIGNSTQMFYKPEASLAAARQLLYLLAEEEIADARVPRAYYDTFQVVVAHGDLARASCFAQRAYETRSIVEGSDSPEVGRMKGYAENPASHPSYRAASNSWKLVIEKGLKGAKEEDMDRWLWKRAASD